jgi:hypothetical protein
VSHGVFRFAKPNARGIYPIRHAEPSPFSSVLTPPVLQSLAASPPQPSPSGSKTRASPSKPSPSGSKTLATEFSLARADKTTPLPPHAWRPRGPPLTSLFCLASASPASSWRRGGCGGPRAPTAAPSSPASSSSHLRSHRRHRHPTRSLASASPSLMRKLT